MKKNWIVLLKSSLTTVFIMVLLLTSCGKDDEFNPNPDTEPESSSINIKVDYENRTYELGETIQATVTVTEDHATDNYFELEVGCYGGEATGTLEGEKVEWHVAQSVFYEIINAESSSKVLHFTFTPVEGQKANQNYTFRFQVTGADKTKAEARISVSSSNSAEIVPTVEYKKDPIELTDLFEVTIQANKDNYHGEFYCSTSTLEGKGYFIISGEPVTERMFKLQAGEKQLLQYQPMSVGVHRLQFSIIDDVCSVNEVVEFEVFNQGGVSKPGNGIYIYTAEGIFFTSEYWKNMEDKSQFSPEGVAVIDDKTKFLLAMERSSGVWAYPPESAGTDHADYMSIMPDMTWASDQNAAINDFNGLKNTKTLIDAEKRGDISQAQAARYCYNYDPQEPGKWYMPAAGQLYLIVQNFEEVQKCIELIGGQKFEYEYYYNYYCSSTGANNSYIWCIQCYSSGKAKFDFHWIFPRTIYNCYPVRDLIL